MSLLIFSLRRLGRTVLVVFGLTVVVFVLGRTLTDPARVILPLTASERDVQLLNQNLGLDKPLPEQFAVFLKNAVQGDLGDSYWQSGDALTLAVNALPASLLLASTTMLVAFLIGFPIGLIGGRRPGSLADRVATSGSSLGVSVPDFWTAILLIILFAVTLGWLPTSGYGGIQHLILPVMALALRPIALLARLTRESTRGEIGKHYVQTARAKGLTERAVMSRHVLKNLLPLTITLMSFEFLLMFTGAAGSVEMVFNWPGMGKLAIEATRHRDLALLSAIVIVTGTLIAVFRMFLEIWLAAIDPRVRD